MILPGTWHQKALVDALLFVQKEAPVEVTIVTDSDLPEQFRAANFYSLPEAELDKRSDEFVAWCKANRVYYYARPREAFFRWEAFELAEKDGCEKLLMEDMS